MYKCTIEEVDGVKHFFVSFRDINCHTHKLEVNEHIYNTFHDFRRNEKKQKNEFDRHIEHITLSEIELYCRAFRKDELPDEQMLQTELYQKVYSIIDNLPKRQRRRAILFFEYDLSYKQIADLENRSIGTISESIHAARGKIFEQLENFFKEI